MEKKLIPLIINPELAKVAPPLAEHEKAILKEDILEHGCKFPLIVWNGVIVDGHNRYEICMENNIPFGIEEMEFSDMTEAKIWIIRNQLGRRNLTDFQRCEMVLPLEKEMKAEGRKRMSAKERGLIKLSNLGGHTRGMLAEMAGVSEGTLDKVKIILGEADDETLDRLRRGKMKIHRAYMQIQDQKPETSAEPEISAAPDRPTVAAHIDHPILFNPVKTDGETNSETNSETIAETNSETNSETDTAPIVSMRIAHPMPFIPDLDPPKPESVLEKCDDFVADTISEAEIVSW